MHDDSFTRFLNSAFYLQLRTEIKENFLSEEKALSDKIQEHQSAKQQQSKTSEIGGSNSVGTPTSTQIPDQHESALLKVEMEDPRVTSLQKYPEKGNFRNLQVIVSSPCSLTSSPLDFSPNSTPDCSPIDGSRSLRIPHAQEYDSSDVTPLSGILQNDKGENENAVELSVTRGSS